MQKRPAVCCLVRVGAEAILDGWAAPAMRDQQAGRERQTQTAHPRRTGDAALGKDEGRAASPVDTGTAGPAWVESDSSGSGEQECAHGVGLAESGGGL